MRTSIFLFLAFFAVILSCNTQNENSSVTVRLTDDPADYKAVWVDIQSIEFHYTNTEGEGNWSTLDNFTPGIYNLLDYSNGKDTVLVSTDVNLGEISQIRLILGENNSIVTESDSVTLEVPSGYTSGLKINLHESFEAGIMKNIWIDFNASKSIVKTGNGKYQLKPVIRAYTESVSGAIKGSVSPKESLPNVYIVSGTDTLSTNADTTGYFFLGGVPAGTYTLHFKPVAPYLEFNKDGVVVTNGDYTELGTVQISQ